MDASEEIESIIYTYSDFILMLIHNLPEHWREFSIGGHVATKNPFI